jgi:signal transduction histidine kinase
MRRLWAKVVIRQSMDARHAERERIARDLHDTLLQGIQALLFRLQIWASDPAIPEERRSEIATVVTQAREIVMEGRDRILTLRKGDPEPRDLLESLRAIGVRESFGQVATFQIVARGKPRPLLAETCQQLIDIGREAIRNAHRHAGANSVAMTVDYRNRSLRLRIADDGRGIDPEILELGYRHGHFGLVGMRERAAQLGARFRIESNGRDGTRITVIVPSGIAFVGSWKWPWYSRERSPQ